MEYTNLNSVRLPACYVAISEEEMTYIEGGALTDNITPEQVMQFGLNVVVNTLRLLGRAAVSSAYEGIKNAMDDGLSIGGAIDHFWGRQNTVGKVGTVVMGALGGFYLYTYAMETINSLYGLYLNLKEVYEQTMKQQTVVPAAA